MRFEVGGGGEPRRLDQFLAEALATGPHAMTRSQVRRLVDEGAVRVNGAAAAAKAGVRLYAGDEVVVVIAPPAPARAQAQDIPLDVLFEDDHLIVVDKPPGLVVHPSPGHPDGTLVNALLARATGLSGVGGELRPGIVHRLDRGTSGVIVATKDDATHVALAALFKAKTLRREYLALLAPPPPRLQGTIDTLYGRHPVHRKRFSSKVERGKRAVTHYWVEERLAAGAAALVRCRLETGRTHQIRVHCADAGWPVVGDPVYGRKSGAARVDEVGAALGRQALHAAVLAFVHPVTKEPLEFETAPPADMQRALAALRATTAA